MDGCRPCTSLPPMCAPTFCFLLLTTLLQRLRHTTTQYERFGCNLDVCFQTTPDMSWTLWWHNYWNAIRIAIDTGSGILGYASITLQRIQRESLTVCVLHSCFAGNCSKPREAGVSERAVPTGLRISCSLRTLAYCIPYRVEARHDASLDDRAILPEHFAR